MNDPTNWNPKQDFDALTFASYTDAKKAEVLFNRMQREIERLSVPPEVAQLSKLRRYDMEDVGLRYQSHFIMEETDNGDWVRFEDVEMLFTPSPLRQIDDEPLPPAPASGAI